MHSISKKRPTLSIKLQSNNNNIKINKTNPKNNIKSVKTKSLSIKSISKSYSTTKSISIQQQSSIQHQHQSIHQTRHQLSLTTSLTTSLHTKPSTKHSFSTKSIIPQRSFSSIQTSDTDNETTAIDIEYNITPTTSSIPKTPLNHISLHNLSAHEKELISIKDKFQQAGLKSKNNHEPNFQFDEVSNDGGDDDDEKSVHSDDDNDDDYYDDYDDDKSVDSYDSDDDAAFYRDEYGSDFDPDQDDEWYYIWNRYHRCKSKEYVAVILSKLHKMLDLRYKLKNQKLNHHLLLEQVQNQMNKMNDRHLQVLTSNQLLQNNLKLLRDGGETSIQPIIHFPLINWSYNDNTIQIHNHTQHIFDIFHQSIIPQLIIGQKGQQGQNESQNYISNRELNEIAYLYTKAPLNNNNTNNNNNSDINNSNNNTNNNIIHHINTNPWIKITNKDEPQYNIATMNGYQFKWTNYIDFDFTDNLKSSSSSISNHINNNNHNKKKLQIKRKEVNLNESIYNMLFDIDELSEQLLIIRNSDVYNFSIPTPIVDDDNDNDDGDYDANDVDGDNTDKNTNSTNNNNQQRSIQNNIDLTTLQPIDIFNQNVNQGLLPFLSTQSNDDNTLNKSNFDGTIERSLATIKLQWKLKTTLTKQQKKQIKLLSKVFSHNYKSHSNQYITNTTIKIETPSAVNQNNNNNNNNNKEVNSIRFKIDFIDKSTTLQDVIDQISSSSSSSITQLSYKTFLISSKSVLSRKNVEIIGNNGIVQDLKHIRIGELVRPDEKDIYFKFSNSSLDSIKQ